MKRLGKGIVVILAVVLLLAVAGKFTPPPATNAEPEKASTFSLINHADMLIKRLGDDPSPTSRLVSATAAQAYLQSTRRLQASLTQPDTLENLEARAATQWRNALADLRRQCVDSGRERVQPYI